LEDEGSAEVGDTRIGGNFRTWINWLGGLCTIAALIYNINVEFSHRTEYGQKKWIEEIIEEQEKKDHPEIKRINVKVKRFDQNDGGDIKTGYATLSGDGETVDVVFKSNLAHEKEGKHSMEVMWHPAIGGRPYGDQIYNSVSEQNK